MKLQTVLSVTGESSVVERVIHLPNITFDTGLKLSTKLVDVAVSGLSAACEKYGWMFVEEVAFLMGFFYFFGF